MCIFGTIGDVREKELHFSSHLQTKYGVCNTDRRYTEGYLLCSVY